MNANLALAIEDLRSVVAQLRGPEGCPWDKVQTHQTLCPYALEEVHELVAALEGGSDAEIHDELGDVLFQVVLHSQLAAEAQRFDLASVIHAQAQKLRRRHPHVFGSRKLSTPMEVTKLWELMKAQERLAAKAPPLAIQVPLALPALQRSYKIGQKANKVDFDWAGVPEVFAKVKEELAEFEVALSEHSQKLQPSENLREEFGDLLFSLAQLARHLNFEPEQALREANEKFLTRFEAMVAEVQNLENFVALPREEKEGLWQKVKKSFSSGKISG